MKKLIIPLLIAVMIFGSTLTTHAAVTADYANATYYLELPSGQRVMTEYALNWGKHPLYIKVDSDSMYLLSQKHIFICNSNGDYDTWSEGIGTTYTFDGSEWNAKKFTFPFTIGGVSVNNPSEVDTKIATSGNFKGVVYRVYDGQSISEAQDFFKNPLVVAVEMSQGLAKEKMTEMSPTVSLLVACAVGLMALLISLKVLPKVLFRFLN